MSTIVRIKQEGDNEAHLGTQYAMGKVENALNQLLTLAELIESSLLGNLLAQNQIAIEDIASLVKSAVIKLTGNARESSQPVLLRTQLEIHQDANLEDIMDRHDGILTKHYGHIIQTFHLVTINDLLRLINVFSKTDKRYYTSWSITTGEIEFSDHPQMFSFHGGDFNYWEERLRDDTPLNVLGSMTLRTWGELKQALRGEQSSIHESRLLNLGTQNRPLREGMVVIQGDLK